METSIYIAKLIAVVYFFMGLGLVLNASYFKKAFEDMYKSPAVAFYGGMAALVVGFVIVSAHNVWVMDWTVLITLLGWGGLVKGVMLMLAPEFLLKISRPVLKNLSVIGFGAVLLGVVFGYFGFIA